jgi:PAS domain S-box-containing protein
MRTEIRDDTVQRRLLRRLAEISRRLIKVEDRDQVLGTLCEALTAAAPGDKSGAGDFDLAWVAAPDERGAIWPIAWSGAGAEGALDLERETGPVAEVLASGASRATRDGVGYCIRVRFPRSPAVLSAWRSSTAAPSLGLIELLESLASAADHALLRIASEERWQSAERALEQADEAARIPLEERFEYLPMPLCLLDAQRVLIRSNREFRSLVDGGPVPFDDLLEQALAHPSDFRYVNRSGRELWLRMRASTMSGPAGASDAAFFVAIVDVSREHVAQASLAFQRRELEKQAGVRAEQGREEAARLRAILDAAVDALLSVDQDGILLCVNASACLLSGRGEDELVGLPAFQVIEGLILPSGTTPRPREAVLRHASGRTIPIEYLVASPRYEVGVRYHAVYTVIVHDITERKRSEQALLESEERYRVLFATSPDGIIQADLASGAVRWANPAASRLLGHPIPRLMTLALGDIHSDETVARIREAAEKESSATLDDTPCTRAGGTTVYADINVTALVVQGVRSALCLYRDASARHHLTAQLMKLTRAIEHSPVSVTVTDRCGQIEYVNPKFCQVTGYSAEEAIGRRPNLLKSGLHDDAFYQEMWGRILGGQEWHGEICNRKKNGEIFWESGSIAPILNRLGEITHFVAIKLDITERRRVAEELRQARDAAEAANRAKSSFLANMSHEIRTPLNAIIGFSQLLMASAETAPADRKAVAAIHRSGEHLLALINDVLELSKIEAGRSTVDPTEFNLHELLDDLATMFRVRTDARALRLTVEVSHGLPRLIRLDQGKLRQILVNLIGNAVKFTERGSISVRAWAQSVDDERTLVIDVEDSGCGIDGDDIERIFNPFEQTKRGRASGGGTGLGLAISREFCHLMDGQLGVRSIVGTGSLFRIILPFEEGAPTLPSAPAKAVVPLSALPDTPVLVVDDVEDNRIVLCKWLEEAGMEVRQACDGVEALEVYEEVHPAIVLLDMRMPVMDGYETARQLRLRQGDRELFIVAVTASAFEEDRAKILDAGADEWLRKPIRFSDLAECLRTRCGLALDLEAGQRAPTWEDGKLDDLPDGLRARLHDAVVIADSERLRELVAEARGISTSAADMLEALAEQYEYDRLLALLEKQSPG